MGCGELFPAGRFWPTSCSKLVFIRRVRPAPVNRTGKPGGKPENQPAPPVGTSMQDTELNSQIKVTFATEASGPPSTAGLIRATRHVAVFEVPNPLAGLRVAGVLPDFTIGQDPRKIYAGRAVVRSLIHSGAKVLCEATLTDEGWLGLDVASMHARPGGWPAEYHGFLAGWQKLYRIVPDYKLMIADMQTFFSDLRFWLTQVELGLAALPEAEREARERQLAAQLAEIIIPSISDLFDKFEEIALQLDPAVSATHQHYMRRQLHAMVLEAPFAHRTYTKPLGYAGDYEMVNMILRDAPEGGSLFAKVLHAWFVRQKPAEAHRNRIDYLVQKISEAVLQASAGGRKARIFNMACGPANEVQRFVAESPLRARADFTLLDFNEETLNYTRACIDAAAGGQAGRPPVQYIKKSVHQLIKEGVRKGGSLYKDRFDLVYCAGLFDYLSDDVCHLLLNIMYEWVAPGGLLVATNVEPGNPRRHGMDHLLDWPLIYRTAADMDAIKPTEAPVEEVRVYSDHTGVNVFLEANKPSYG